MPVVSRKYLRRTLGTRHLRDTYVGTTTASWNQQAHSLNIFDAAFADLSLSGQGLYVGAWLYLSQIELRVASFNAPSGVFFSVSRGHLLVSPASGDEYERHDMLPAGDKNLAIDDAVKRLRVRREVPLWSVDGLHAYSLPRSVEQVLGGYYFASPAGTLDRERGELRSVEVVVTATGPEVRIEPALAASQHLILDAITTVSLGAADDATVNIPDERLVLYAAEAACWDLLTRKAPRGTADEYRNLRAEAARQYSQLARNYKIPIDRPLRLDGDW